MITLIWAQTKDGVIGKDNKLPWNIKEEMQHFINYTQGKTVFMGRNTWESLKLKPLPNRKNIVLTSRPLNSQDSNLEITNNLKNVLKNYQNNEEELIIIGGSKIYESTIDFANKLIVSYIHKEFDGDTFAPKIDTNIFKITNKVSFLNFDVITYERKS